MVGPLPALVRCSLLALGLCLPPAILAAQAAATVGQARSGPRPLLPEAREIALARSAAPAAVSDSATIFVLGDTGYRVAVTGTSGVACYVSRGWPGSIEPHCLDAEGAATIMLMDMRRVELRHRGAPHEEEEQEIQAGLASGRFRLPRRPVLSWMMSAAQQLISDGGTPVGAWQPHLMIYYPYLTAAETGLAGPPDPRHAMLTDAGRPTANLTIVVRDFIEPRMP
ncbi:MAG: hypothetical protein ABR551_03610 [Gemmatimonadales bacterium]